MNVEMIPREAEALLDWLELAEALAEGHRGPRAEVGDTFLFREPDTLLSRAAWIDGMGMAVKTATVFPENPADHYRTVNGAVNLYTDAHGILEAILDFHLVTKWKTAADSLLGARLLARPDSHAILIVGAGNVAISLREAYGALFPDARYLIWNRTPAGAEAIAAHYPDTLVATDLESAVSSSDIITCATTTREPGDITVFKNGGGAHLDLMTSRYILEKWRAR